MTITIVPFPAALPQNTLGDSTGLEPSGLVLAHKHLYMASDDGKIAYFDGSAWQTGFTADNNTFSGKPDFESITLVTGQLMVGIEGRSGEKPQIVRFDMTTPTAPKPSSSWTLELPDGVSASSGGMEAMTFVPKEYCPTFTTEAPYYGGYFFTGYQSSVGKIYVYNLPKGGGKLGGKGGKPVHTYTIPNTMKSSDLCFANGVLYALFDGGGGDDTLDVYTLHTQDKNTITFQKRYGLPEVVGSKKDYEGITFNGQTIYLARDSKTNPNFVYRFDNTIIYPQTVLAPIA